ncbi:unnamed protein product [Ectocarpus sp. 12 AP-2014]
MVSWTESHQPTRLGDVSGNDEVIRALQSYKTIEAIPNMILHGPPGSGKTSSVLAMAKSFFGGSSTSTMILELNAGDSRGIETMRDQINFFTKCPSVTERSTDALKLVILDEADGLTTCAQRALRHLIETSSSRARFCLCCNHINKLSSGLRSRCTSFSFSGVGKAQLARTLREVARKERLEISEGALNAVVNVCAGDARQGINLLQSLSLGDATTLTARDDQAVYQSCGLPSPTETSTIFNALVTQSFSAAFDTLASFVSRKQFSVLQVIPPLVESVISCKDRTTMIADREGEVLSALADVEHCLSDGGSEGIAIGATVGAFHFA